jgi:hypothetical protein
MSSLSSSASASLSGLGNADLSTGPGVDGLARRGQDCGYLRALPLLRQAPMVTLVTRLVAGHTGSWDQALAKRWCRRSHRRNPRALAVAARCLELDDQPSERKCSDCPQCRESNTERNVLAPIRPSHSHDLQEVTLDHSANIVNLCLTLYGRRPLTGVVQTHSRLDAPPPSPCRLLSAQSLQRLC